mmetsp:Transcript_45266/g.113960  ORF Transcript_45266/g.113960 Transcript_45266/m.113960 type:complete len:277 (+) Transcript_45266:480-1310(+)
MRRSDAHTHLGAGGDGLAVERGVLVSHAANHSGRRVSAQALAEDRRRVGKVSHPRDQLLERRRLLVWLGGSCCTAADGQKPRGHLPEQLETHALLHLRSCGHLCECAAQRRSRALGAGDHKVDKGFGGLAIIDRAAGTVTAGRQQCAQQAELIAALTGCETSAHVRHCLAADVQRALHDGEVVGADLLVVAGTRHCGVALHKVDDQLSVHCDVLGSHREAVAGTQRKHHRLHALMNHVGEIKDLSRIGERRRQLGAQRGARTQQQTNRTGTYREHV